MLLRCLFSYCRMNSSTVKVLLKKEKGRRLFPRIVLNLWTVCHSVFYKTVHQDLFLIFVGYFCSQTCTQSTPQAAKICTNKVFAYTEGTTLKVNRTMSPSTSSVTSWVCTCTQVCSRYLAQVGPSASSRCYFAKTTCNCYSWFEAVLITCVSTHSSLHPHNLLEDLWCTHKYPRSVCANKFIEKIIKNNATIMEQKANIIIIRRKQARYF